MKATIGCLIGLVLGVSAWAEPLLEGRVRLESGEPVADAQVRLFDMTDLRQGPVARATTDGAGYFALPLAVLAGSVLPERFTLGPNYPNPFNPSTIIPYQLAASSQVRLEVQPPIVAVLGAGESQSIALTNRGAESVRVGSASIGGRHPGAFVIGTDECSGSALGPKASCKIAVRHVSTSARTANHAVLKIPNNDAIAPELTVSLFGGNPNSERAKPVASHALD